MPEITPQTEANINNMANAMQKMREHYDEVMNRLDHVETVFERQQLGGTLGGGQDSTKQQLLTEQAAVAKYFRSRDPSDLIAINQRNGGASVGDVRNSMSVGSDPDGGYLVLSAFSSTMTKKLYDVSPMRRLARVETIGAGDRWIEPIDYDQPASGWVGEKEARVATDTPRIGQLTVPVNELYAMPPVTQNLLDDLNFDLGAWLTGKVVEKFARDEGIAFILGNEVTRPQGLLSAPVASAGDNSRPWGTLQYVATGASGGFKTGDNPSIAGDCLRDLTWKLRSPYRQGASWLMKSNVISLIDKLKDSQGNYLFRPGMTAGAPNMLLGYPVEIDDVGMPDVGANSLSIAFGNFKLGYLIVDKIGIKILVDPYTNKPHVNYYFYKRVGAGVANSEAIKLLRFSTS